jgi:PIN domain nuclease of toxin-antitoxin system
MTLAVLDASALLALLLREPGAEKVAVALGDAAISAVNLAEVASQYALRGSAGHEVRELTSQFSAQVVPFDEDLALVAGALAPSTKSAGLSMGDRACFALALRLGARVVTADRIWTRVAEAVGVEVELIR